MGPCARSEGGGAGTRFRREGGRCRVRGVGALGLREVNAEEKPELFSPFPWNVEMGRVYGTLRLLGFPRLRVETDLRGSSPSLIHGFWVW